MDNPANTSGAVASAIVWPEADGFRVTIQINDPTRASWESSTHIVSGFDTIAVRKLIEREVGEHGFDIGSCGIWWKPKELILLP